MNLYRFVSLCRDGKARHHLVHRLVAEAFIPNPENKPEVNHENGIKHDNRLSNLTWTTHGENNKHSYDHLGRTRRTGARGEAHPDAKLTAGKVRKMRRLFETGAWNTVRLGKRFNVAPATVSNAVHRKTWKDVK